MAGQAMAEVQYLLPEWKIRENPQILQLLLRFGTLFLLFRESAVILATPSAPSLLLRWPKTVAYPLCPFTRGRDVPIQKALYVVMSIY